MHYFRSKVLRKLEASWHWTRNCQSSSEVELSFSNYTHTSPEIVPPRSQLIIIVSLSTMPPLPQRRERKRHDTTHIDSIHLHFSTQQQDLGVGVGENSIDPSFKFFWSHSQIRCQRARPRAKLRKAAGASAQHNQTRHDQGRDQAAITWQRLLRHGSVAQQYCGPTMLRDTSREPLVQLVDLLPERFCVCVVLVWDVFSTLPCCEVRCESDSCNSSFSGLVDRKENGGS